MKTKAVIAALIIMTGVVQAKASEQVPSLTISHQDGSSVFRVNYNGSQKGDVKMTIRDNLGNVLVAESIKGVKAFSLPVNLEGVDAGVYDIEIDNGTDKQIQTLNFSDPVPTTYAHVTRLGDDRYLLSVAHTGAEEINVRILDDAGSPVFEQEQWIEGNFARVYYVKNSVGSLSFEVTDASGDSLITQ
jgi:hypothetical protein